MRANRLLVRSSFGWSSEEQIGDGQLVIEGLESLGTQPSPQEVSRVAQARLSVLSQDQTQITVGIEPAGLADSPGHAYNPGDTVELAGAPVRVSQVSGARDDDGIIRWVPSVGAIIPGQVERTENAVRKMVGGTGQGAFDEATPIHLTTDRGQPADMAVTGEVEFFLARTLSMLHIGQADQDDVWPSLTIPSTGVLMFALGVSIVGGRAISESGGFWQVTANVRGVADNGLASGSISVQVANQPQWLSIPLDFPWVTGGTVSGTITSQLPLNPGDNMTVVVRNDHGSSGALFDVELSGHWVAPGAVDNLE